MRFAMFPDNDATRELQTKFAVALLRKPDEPFVAAQEVFGADAGAALYAASHWIQDAFVLAEQQRLLKEKGPRSFLPSKEEYAREVWKLALGERTPIEDKRALLSLYGDIMGHKQKAENPGINVNVTQNKVMIVKDHGSDDDWEAQAIAQQHRLANNVMDVTDVTPA